MTVWQQCPEHHAAVTSPVETSRPGTVARLRAFGTAWSLGALGRRPTAPTMQAKLSGRMGVDQDVAANGLNTGLVAR